MARCLVIGGAGFIGSHLVESLVARGETVRVLDNFSTGSVSNIAPLLGKIQLLVGDVADEELIAQAMKGIDTVFHYAPPPEWLFLSPDSLGSGVTSLRRHQGPSSLTNARNVLAAAHQAGVRRVIYASSARVYGCADSVPLSEDHPLNPVSSLAITTLAGEQDCCAFTSLSGLETVRLRYFNVFGPRQSSASLAAEIIGQAIKAMLVGRRPVIPGNGFDPQDFLYIDDVVHANLLVAQAQRVSGRVYNIARGHPTTALEIVSLLNRILGSKLRPIHTAPLAPADGDNLADVARGEAELGFCSFTDLEKGLRHCVDYYSRWRDSLLPPRQEAAQAAPLSSQESGEQQRVGPPHSQVLRRGRPVR
ncbi:MAG TPA: NAD-dependent epimerase/dehydratase family protein [Gemmataceae bacterium]|jgi:UDP-glucose 4-epimerase